MNENRRYAIVTGAARGIGKGISLSLAKNGYAVCAAGRKSESEVSGYIDELKSYSPESFYISADISEEADRKRIVSSAFEAFGDVHVLVNNAGVAPNVRADLLEMGEESFDRLMNINLKGPFFLTQLFANEQIKHINNSDNIHRCVVFITSISAEVSSINRGEYCISKAGLSMSVKLYADRLAQYGINVYEVRPGIIATDMTAGVRKKYDALIADGLLPISRIGTPDDVAVAVQSLADGALHYSTGEVINVDGGFMLRRL